MSFRQIKSFDLSDLDFEEERHMEYRELAHDAKVLKEVFQDLNKLVSDAQEPLEKIETLTDNVIQNVENGNSALTKAVLSNRLKKTILLITITTFLGGCIGGPLGGGAVLGLTSALGGYITAGSIIGGAAVGAVTGAGAFGGGTGVLVNLCKKKSN